MEKKIKTTISVSADTVTIDGIGIDLIRLIDYGLCREHVMLW